MINACAVVCMYSVVHAELVEVFLRLLEMLLIRCHVLFCETIYQVFECLIPLPIMLKLHFQLRLNIFLSICNSYEFQKFVFSKFFLWLQAVF